jgi:hypothetical protein
MTSEMRIKTPAKTKRTQEASGNLAAATQRKQELQEIIKL